MRSGLGRMSKKIGAMVISYNDAVAVENLLQALAMQTCPLDSILVIDNSWPPLEIRVDFESPTVEFKNFGENIGVAAGLVRAFDWAKNKGLEWLWLFDQDSEPSITALKVLIEAAERPNELRNDVAIFSCSVFDSCEGKIVPGYVWDSTSFVELRRQSAPTPYECDAVISSGSLVRVEAVQSCDLPSSKLFIDGIDFALCYNLRLRGLKIIVIPDAELMHRLGSPTMVKLPFRTTPTPYYHLSLLRAYCICRNFTHLEMRFSSRMVWPIVIVRRFKHVVYFALGAIFVDGRRLSLLWAALLGTLHGFLEERFWPSKPPMLE